MNSYDSDFYRRTTNLKKKNPALKVFIAVGGWDAGGKVFSDTARTAGSRRAFIDSAIRLMQSYSFDGIDIDWEYPFAPDRGGADEDVENFVTLMKELKAACGSRYGVTLTLPSSYCKFLSVTDAWILIRAGYMQGFDVAGLQDHVDWFQFMSYDIRESYTLKLINIFADTSRWNVGRQLALHQSRRSSSYEFDRYVSFCS